MKSERKIHDRKNSRFVGDIPNLLYVLCLYLTLTLNDTSKMPSSSSPAKPHCTEQKFQLLSLPHLLNPHHRRERLGLGSSKFTACCKGNTLEEYIEHRVYTLFLFIIPRYNSKLIKMTMRKLRM